MGHDLCTSTMYTFTKSLYCDKKIYTNMYYMCNEDVHKSFHVQIIS
jgi:hypothetical protein